MLHEPHESDTNAAQVKNFDFDNEMIENIFSHLYISYIAKESYRKRNKFILRTTFWKRLVLMPKSFEMCTSKAELCSKNT